MERLELSLRRVNYEDHSGAAIASGSPEKISIDLNVQNRVYLNIRDPQTLVNLIIFEILRSASFSDLLGLGPDKLLGAAFNAGKEFVGAQANAFSKQAGNVAGQAGDFVNQSGIQEKTGSVIEASVRGAQSALSGFWGKLKSLMPEKNAQ
ncbi:MAG: hypothetical protein WCP55_25660 [Lentisphaerota bacterium]